MALPQSDQKMTEAEYLVFERDSDIRHEFVNGDIIAMTGGSWNHSLIIANTHRSLGNQLEGNDCESVTGEMRIHVDSAKVYRYPDVMVVCGEPKFVEDDDNTLINPSVLIEVLSPSTASINRIQKLDEYLKIPDLDEYLIISQDVAKIMQYIRQTDGSCRYCQVSGLDKALDLPSIGCTLTLTEVYRKVIFPESDED